MPVIRAFIAIELPVAIQDQLDKVARELQAQITTHSIHWVAAKNIHLTLKFLGEVSSTNLDILKKNLSVEVSKHSHFSVSIGGLGAFPSIRRPRVVWIGVDAPPLLNNLQKGIENETTRLGYQVEERGFSPHLTLGRIAHNASPDEIRKTSEVLANAEVGILGSFIVGTICLFKSDLLPGGAVYTLLFETPLKQDAASPKV